MVRSPPPNRAARRSRPGHHAIAVSMTYACTATLTLQLTRRRRGGHARGYPYITDRTSPPTPAPRTITPAELAPPPKFGRSQQERCTHEGRSEGLISFSGLLPFTPHFWTFLFFFRCTLQPRVAPFALIFVTSPLEVNTSARAMSPHALVVVLLSLAFLGSEAAPVKTNENARIESLSAKLDNPVRSLSVHETKTKQFTCNGGGGPSCGNWFNRHTCGVGETCGHDNLESWCCPVGYIVPKGVHAYVSGHGDGPGHCFSVDGAQAAYNAATSGHGISIVPCWPAQKVDQNGWPVMTTDASD